MATNNAHALDYALMAGSRSYPVESIETPMQRPQQSSPTVLLYAHSSISSFSSSAGSGTIAGVVESSPSHMDTVMQIWEREDLSGRFPIEGIAYFDRSRPIGHTMRQCLNTIGKYAHGLVVDLGSVVAVYSSGRKTLGNLLEDSIGQHDAGEIINRRNTQEGREAIVAYDLYASETFQQQECLKHSPEALNKLHFLYMTMVLAHRVLFQDRRWDV